MTNEATDLELLDLQVVIRDLKVRMDGVLSEGDLNREARGWASAALNDLACALDKVTWARATNR